MSQPTRDEIRRGYAQSGARYDSERVVNPRGALLTACDHELFSAMLPGDLRSASIVEVGAGTGRFTLVALEAGLTVTATDVNESLLAELRQKVDSRGFEARCRIQTEDVFHLSFEDASVDFVFGIHIIPRFLTLDDQRAALQEIARILKPGGRVLFNFRNRSSLLYGRIDAKHAARDAEIEEILRSSGLRILDKRGKWLLNGRLIELVGVRIARLIARADRALWKFDPAHAWDVFVLAQKQPR